MSGWVAAAVAGAAVVGAGAAVYSSNQSSAAAANATAGNKAAAGDATALQKYQFDVQQDNMRPWLTAGTGAVNQLANRMGVDTQSLNTAYQRLTTAEIDTLNNRGSYSTESYYDPGTLLKYDLSKEWYRGPDGSIVDKPATMVTTPGMSVSDPGNLLNTPTFQFDQSKVQTDPGYAFRMKQGVNAITAAGAAGGNLGSGNLGVALQNYGQELGSQEYGAAYQRAYGSQMDQYNSGLNAQNTLFNRLSGVAGTGQTAAGQIGAAGMGMANNVGQIATQTAGMNGQIEMQNAQQQGNMVGNVLQTGVNAYGAYNQNQLYQNYLNGGANGQTYGQAGGNINNVDFGSFGDTSSMSW